MPSRVGKVGWLHGAADGRAEVPLSLACSAEAVRLIVEPIIGRINEWRMLKEGRQISKVVKHRDSPNAQRGNLSFKSPKPTHRFSIASSVAFDSRHLNGSTRTIL